MIGGNKIGVVIPCYRVTRQILGVLAEIGPEVDQIFCVDDHCPDGSGTVVEQNCTDPRVVVIRHEQNGGVGAAVTTGYTAGLAAGCDILVKIDGDGQMDPALLAQFVGPIVRGRADYTKGNRFYNPADVRPMPFVRLIGNVVLSFMTKVSSGYYRIFDPTNGYTAIHAKVLARLPQDKIAKRYFFESDMLFRLGTLRAVVLDVPMAARYRDEMSNLKVRKIIGVFLWRNLVNTFKRVGYQYFVRDFNYGSIALILGSLFFVFGGIFGALKWDESRRTGEIASAGTVMLSALPILVGLQLFMAFIREDMSAEPTVPLQRIW